MKWLLCSSAFGNQEDLLHHYIDYHNVDENNLFFQKLFQIKNKTVLKRCVRGEEFLTTDKHKLVHNFLKHYDEGKNIPFEDTLIDVLRFNGLTVYSVEFQKHKDFYNFFNSEEVVDDFLKNVKYTFKTGEKKLIKCSFTIEKIQQSRYQYLRPIINSRY